MSKQKTNTKLDGETGSPSKPGGSTALRLFAVTPGVGVSGVVVASHGPPSDTDSSERSKAVAIPNFRSGGVVNNDPTTSRESEPLPSTSRRAAQLGGVRVVNNGPPTTGEGSPSKTLPANTQNRPSKDSYMVRLTAPRILKTFGNKLEVEGKTELDARIKWTQCIKANAQTSGDSTSKRQRSIEGTIPVPKRPKVHNTSTLHCGVSKTMVISSKNSKKMRLT